MEEKLENSVSLFIPVYNIGRSFNRDLEEFYTALLSLRCDFEIFIVDDHSTDESCRFIRTMNTIEKTSGKEIKYLYYDRGPSRRENLARSFYLATHEIICFIDADLNYNIPSLLKAIYLLQGSSSDIVIGSRYVKGAKIKRRFRRMVISFFYNLTMRLLFQSNIKDHQCGLKVFRKSTVMPIIDQMGYDDKFNRGWFWDTELLIRAQKKKLKIVEIPVEWHETKSSTFNIPRELRMLRAIVKLKRELG